MTIIRVIIEKTNTGYSAYAEDLPVYTTGSDLKETQKNMVEALSLHFDVEDLLSEYELILELQEDFA